MKVAIIKMHDNSVWRAIALTEGQSIEFDPDSATRRWLWPFLRTEYHLLDIVEVENLPNVSNK